MKSTLGIEIEGEPLSRLAAEVAVAGFFRDQRPLRGGAGLADWRLCGWVSGLVGASRLAGEWGEAALVLTQARLQAPRLLLLGLGPQARFGPDAHREAARAALERIVALGAGVAAIDLPAPNGVDAPERVAAGLLAGACDALDPRSTRVLLRVAAQPGQAPRWRAAFEQGAASLPRGSTSIKLVRPPAAPAGAAGLRAARPGRAEAPLA
ncbi:MAG TPA: M17 family peptidase N-terminal domain-containing protein [Myxococcota bacterium]|nr:M17 family peptidase N-terminal domain-containing protein [Myxococcota bacterium]